RLVEALHGLHLIKMGSLFKGSPFILPSYMHFAKQHINSIPFDRRRKNARPDLQPSRVLALRLIPQLEVARQTAVTFEDRAILAGYDDRLDIPTGRLDRPLQGFRLRE